MKYIRTTLAFATLFLAITGCACNGHKVAPELSEAIDHPQKIAVFALDEKESEKADLDSSQFYGHTILAKAKPNEAQTAQVIQSLKTSLEEGKKPQNVVKHVLEAKPRHGIRIAYANHIYDLQLCYDCGRLYSFKDGIAEGWSPIGGSSEVLDSLLKIPAKK